MNRYRPPASPTRVCRRALTALLAGLAAATAALADAPPAVAPPSTAPASRPSAVTPLPASTRPATAADYSAYRERWFTLPTKSDPRLTHHAYESAAMSARVGYHLYLPLGYDDPANAARRYPVLYWLHGLNQSESSDWFPPDVLSVAVGGGAIPPVIVVFAAGGGRSFYCDAPDQNILPETTIVRELIPHVDATYRTIAARGGRAIQGVSMGGFGALRLAMTHPDLFSSVVGYMPSLRHPDDLARTYPDVAARMFGGDVSRFWAQHPLTLAREKAASLRADLPIAFYSGTADPLNPGSRELDSLLTELNVPHTYAEVAGAAHNLPKLVGGDKGVAGVGDAGLRFAARHFRTDATR